MQSNKRIKSTPGGSTLNTRRSRKSCLIGFDKSSEETDHGKGGKHARTCEENGLEFISFSIKTTWNGQQSKGSHKCGEGQSNKYVNYMHASCRQQSSEIKCMELNLPPE